MSPTHARLIRWPSGPKALSAALYFLLTFAAAGAARGQAPAAEPVDWVNRVRVSVSNGVLTKIEPSPSPDPDNLDGWDGGATSSQRIESGDGYVEFNPGGQTNTWRMCGLSRPNSEPFYHSIDYAIYTRGDGTIHIFERGVRVATFTAPYAPNETLRVAAEGGRIKYYRNGSVFYTSNTPPGYPLVADASIKSLAGAVANAVIATDASGPVGTWYLKAARGSVVNNPGARLTVGISEVAGGGYQGTMTQEGGATHNLDSVTWEPSTRLLQFRRVGSGWWQWFRGNVVEGVLVGRYTAASASPSQPDIPAYTGHVTGWNSTYIDGNNSTTRVYELLINNGYRARLRLDGPDGARSGRLKVYATVPNNLQGEELEDDIEIRRWDGRFLEFVRHIPGGPQVYTGEASASGRTISGTFTQGNDPTQYPWSGTRAEVLTYGLTAKTAQDRAAWQARTRKRLLHLMMGGNPLAPVTGSRQIAAVFTMTSPPTGRDDDAANHPQNYTLEKVSFSVSFPDPYGGNNIQRNFGGYLAIPFGTPPAGGWPAAVVVNGHSGSAKQTMDPNNTSDNSGGIFWYGDSMARRGHVVLAIDISHRPAAHTRGLYNDPGSVNGDDPRNGNGPRPAVVSSRFAGTGHEDSDWEEDGERAWDVMRGIDYLLSLTQTPGGAPLVDKSRILMTGLSMGGEVTMVVSALDQRISLAIPAGYSPDMNVMSYPHMTHVPHIFTFNHPCWQWLNADIREYVDASDYFALVAPRPLIIETGKQDQTFSWRAFAPDKQVARRARVAYHDAPSKFIHYLHYDEHRFHVGDVGGAELNVMMPVLIAPPTPFSTAWQSDPATRATDPATGSTARTLFGYIDCYFNGNCGI